MSRPVLPTDERLLDLLALRAVEGLDPADEAQALAWGDPEALEEAAAVLALGMLAGDGERLEGMPRGVRTRLEALGLSVVSEATPGPVPRPMSHDAREAKARADRLQWLAGAGWLAAAAAILLAVMAWRTPVVPTLQERLGLLEGRPGVVRAEWLGLDRAALAEAPHRFDRGLRGEVVWDDATNEGYMVFDGLAVNDPSVYQYQLWVFDGTRPTGELPQYGDGVLSQRPVDGGVFDVGVEGRVIVPVAAKLKVGKAVLFAVTVEKPGGVVVSDRDIVTAAVVTR